MKCSSIKRYKLLETLDPRIFFHENVDIAKCENCVPQKVGASKKLALYDHALCVGLHDHVVHVCSLNSRCYHFVLFSGI